MDSYAKMKQKRVLLYLLLSFVLNCIPLLKNAPKGFCVIHFYKYSCGKNAYLWHYCAQRRAQKCSLRSNFTGGEVIFL